MDISKRIKTARQAAEMTQEYVAEQLGVSRQTISHWENNKSYPDIVSVIKMSDLYSISLDELLKGDLKMITYLKESTDTVKSRRTFSKLILVIAYLMVWTLLMILFWFGTGEDGAMGYGILAFYLILPITTVLISFFIGRDRSWGPFRWLMILFFGIMFMLLTYGTFSLANMISFNKVNIPDIAAMGYGIFYSAIGILAGFLSAKLPILKKHR